MLEPWIETFTGKKMYFLNPKEDMIDIVDIAHSLSLQCRFSGHTNRFYSVAEHSFRVASYLYNTHGNAKIALQGLLHDASEAYLLDVPSPVKQHLKGYHKMEEKLQAVILNKFNTGWPMNTRVKEADTIMLKNEARFLLPSKGESWLHLYPTDAENDAVPYCYSPDGACITFLHWFDFLEKENEKQRSTIAA